MKTLYLYCAELKRGTVKVGITENLKCRLRGIAQVYGAVRHAYMSPHPIPGRAAEQELLRRVERLATKRVGEEFRGVRFREAAQLVMQISRRHSIDASPSSIRVEGITLSKCSGLLCIDGSSVGVAPEEALVAWLNDLAFGVEEKRRRQA